MLSGLDWRGKYAGSPLPVEGRGAPDQGIQFLGRIPLFRSFDVLLPIDTGI